MVWCGLVLESWLGLIRRARWNHELAQEIAARDCPLDNTTSDFSSVCGARTLLLSVQSRQAVALFWLVISGDFSFELCPGPCSHQALVHSEGHSYNNSKNRSLQNVGNRTAYRKNNGAVTVIGGSNRNDSCAIKPLEWCGRKTCK